MTPGVERSALGGKSGLKPGVQMPRVWLPESKESSEKIILMLPADSNSYSSPRWKVECQQIEKSVKNANQKSEENAQEKLKPHKFESKPYTTYSDLPQELTALEPSIVHITGEVNGIAELVIGHTSHKTESQDELIADFFKLYSKYIDCVVLSGCYIEDQLYAISQYIKFVVFIPKELEEGLYITFFDNFYFQIVFRQDVERSYEIALNSVSRETKANLVNYPNFREEFLPKILFQEDGINRRKSEEELILCGGKLEVEPDNVKLWKRIASLLKDLGRIEEMNEAYNKVTELEPDYQNRLKQGNALLASGDYEKAEVAYTKALELEENDYKIWWKKAITLVKSGHIMEAGICYKKALSLLPPYSDSTPCPDKYVICKEYGDTLIETNKSCKGIQSYRTSLWLQQNYRLASYNKKQAYKRLYAQNG